MARIRTVKPSFFRHEQLQDLEAAHPGQHVMLVFAALWGHCDKAGRFEWNPRSLKLDILPFLDFDLSASLVLLREAGLVKQYQSGSKTYGEVPTFNEHQRISGKESQEPAKYPEPKEYIAEKQPGSNGEAPETAGREGKGREEEGKTISSLRSEMSADAPEASDLKAILFDGCLQWFIPRGPKNNATARRVIGKWIRDHGEGATLQAFMAAQRASAPDPTAYITKVLNGHVKPASPHKTDADAAAEAIAYFQAQEREVAESRAGHAGPDQPLLGRNGGVAEADAEGRDCRAGGDDDAALLHAGELQIDPPGAIH